jgi:hypothetical protein
MREPWARASVCKVLKALTTIATNAAIRSEAAAAVAVMMEGTCSCGSAGEGYAGETASDHPPMPSVVSLRQE